MLMRVMVPLDGSPLAQTALDFVTSMLDEGSEIVLVTAVQPHEIPLYGMESTAEAGADYASLAAIQKDAKIYLDGIAQTLVKQGFHPIVRVEMGEAALVIAQTAKFLDVQMIVMSTHGRTGISRWLFGSITGKVLGLTQLPVVVVPCQKFQEQYDQEIAELHFG